MKKSLLFALVAAVAMVCAISCDKDNSNDSPNDSDIIGTSYWAAGCSDGTFYLGLMELTDEDKDNSLLDITKFTYSIMAEISTGANTAGFANQKGNTIEASYILSVGAEFPDTYTVSGNAITCSYDDESLTFHQITEQEFFDSVNAFVQE